MDETRKPTSVRLMSLRQYAEYRGVRLFTIQTAIETGRIETVRDERGRVRIDPAVADRQFLENTDPSKQNRGPAADGAPSPSTSPGAAAPAGESVKSTLVRSREKTEIYKARLKRLEYLEKKARLVPADVVKADAFKLARTVRDAILAIPDRLAGILAAETDPHRVHRELAEELARALEALSRGDDEKQ